MLALVPDVTGDPHTWVSRTVWPWVLTPVLPGGPRLVTGELEVEERCLQTRMSLRPAPGAQVHGAFEKSPTWEVQPGTRVRASGPQPGRPQPRWLS